MTYTHSSKDQLSEIKLTCKQECIPVGCLPPAAVTVGGGSASVHAGIDPPQVWAWRPPSQIPLNFPLGCGPGDPPGQIPLNFPLGCGPGNPQGMLGYHPLETCCKACWIPPAMHAGIPLPPSVNRITDTCKNITLPQLRCGR